MNQSNINNSVIHLLDTLPIGILVLNQDGNILYSNNASMKILDIDLFDLIDKKFLDIINDEKMKFALESIFSGITEQAVFTIEKNQTLINVSARNLDDPRFGIGSVLVSIEDITKFKELDKIKTDFVSTLLHRLRTPLTTLKSSLSFLLKSGVIKEMTEVIEIIEMCHTETNRLTFFLNDLRDLFLIESGLIDQSFDHVLVPIGPVIEKAIRSLQTQAKEKNISLSLTTPDISAIIEGDGDRLYQVLTNILANAVTFTRTNGAITVSVSEEDDEVRISISDNGIGMNEDELSHIFEKHYRGDNEITRNTVGYGLGLYIARFFVEYMGGNIFAFSEPGKGSQFDIVFHK